MRYLEDTILMQFPSEQSHSMPWDYSVIKRLWELHLKSVMRSGHDHSHVMLFHCWLLSRGHLAVYGLFFFSFLEDCSPLLCEKHNHFWESISMVVQSGLDRAVLTLGQEQAKYGFRTTGSSNNDLKVYAHHTFCTPNSSLPWWFEYFSFVLPDLLNKVPYWRGVCMSV